MEHKLKVSWTILSNWSAGRRDEALKMLMGEELPASAVMEEGKRIHAQIAQQKLKLIPLVKDTAEFEDMNPEKGMWKNYFKVSVYDWLDLSMVIDVVDYTERLVIDWKTGATPSGQCNKMQVYLYAYAMSILQKQIDWAVIAHVVEYPDQTIGCSDYSVYKITPEKLELAENYVETVASEIYNFIQELREEPTKKSQRVAGVVAPF